MNRRRGRSVLVLAAVPLAMAVGIGRVEMAEALSQTAGSVASSEPTPTPIQTTPTPTPPQVELTAIELRLPGPKVAGADVSVTARLTANGQGIPGSALQYQLDGAQQPSVTTGASGEVSTKLPSTLGPGSHTVGFAFAGDPARGLQSSSAQGSLELIAPRGTSIVLNLANDRRTGQAIAVEASIYADGRPLPGALLHISAASHQVATGSDRNGLVRYSLPRTLPPGTYPVGIEYHGDGPRGVAGSSVAGNLRVLPAVATSVSLSLPPPTRAGQEATITGKLSSEQGLLSARTPLHLVLDNRKRTTLETDSGGSVQIKVPRDLTVGVHSVTLVYRGDQPRGIAGSAASGSLTITRLGLLLQTLPALAGVKFSVDARDYVTGPSGSVSVGLEKGGSHRLSVRGPEDRPDAHVQFSSWFDGERNPDRTLRIFSDETVHAGFTGSFLTPVSLSDADGRQLDASRVGTVQLRGQSGRLIDLQPGQASVWLDVPAPSRAVLLGLGPKLHYSVESARFDGVNVANRGDAAFAPGPARQWNIRLRVYALRLQVRRPILGRKVEALTVTSSAGDRRIIRPDARGVAVLTGMPRGLYSVAAAGASSGPVAYVQMTRDQVLELSTFTTEELVAGAALLALVLCGLVGSAFAARRPVAARRRTSG